ncbi:hypothetical protein [Sphingobium tyrosinilyticum]|uniref:hypothetical protein n=1 Tax=Sphingobium tyrosinilyticum TaxID=2715436 RepID=UPI0036D2FE3E
MNHVLLALSFEECQRGGIWNYEFIGQGIKCRFFQLTRRDSREAARVLRPEAALVTRPAPACGIVATISIGEAVAARASVAYLQSHLARWEHSPNDR